jgi:molecular chaperone HscB
MSNFFILFDLEKKFAIDGNFLERKYLELQSKFHPDKSNHNNPNKAMEINEAFRILSDDFSRACYLLQLENIDLVNDDKAIDPYKSMLLEILELREHIETIENKNIIDNLLRHLKQTIEDLIADFARAYEDNQLQLSATFLLKAKYLKKALEDLKIKKQKLL